MKYTVKPRQKATAFYDWYNSAGPSQITVHEDDDGPEFTGLFDAQGNEIFRVAEQFPIGFRKN